MQIKERLRKKYFFIRKKNYFDIDTSFFIPLIKLINKRYKKKNINLSSYYPASFEVNILKLFDLNTMDRIKIFLPVITGKNSMHFYKWEKNDVLEINKFGMLEPFKSQLCHVQYPPRKLKENRRGKGKREKRNWKQSKQVTLTKSNKKNHK